MQNISWWRNGTPILDNINWKVARGEHWAIIGLNGSGKTSLLRLITGYSFPSAGALHVLGEKFGSCDLRELRKSIGWVSSSLQERLHVDDTVEEIVISGEFASIGLYEKPRRDSVARALNLLEQFGCLELRKREYSSLSQGEKQKVLLARGLMNSPKLLILDEPCVGLDIFARQNLLSLVQQIGKSDNGPTLLYVSHHVEEILPVFEHTLLLRKGTIHSSGETKNVLTDETLSDFFGSRVEIEWREGRPWVRIGKRVDN